MGQGSIHLTRFFAMAGLPGILGRPVFLSG